MVHNSPGTSLDVMLVLALYLPVVRLIFILLRAAAPTPYYHVNTTTTEFTAIRSEYKIALYCGGVGKPGRRISNPGFRAAAAEQRFISWLFGDYD